MYDGMIVFLLIWMPYGQVIRDADGGVPYNAVVISHGECRKACGHPEIHAAL